MHRFIVNRNAQPTGEHEVHDLDAACIRLPDSENRRGLGEFSSCQGAVIEAKKLYSSVDGCYYCCPDCHTR